MTSLPPLDPLGEAQRWLEALPRAESETERATLLATAAALVAPVRAKVDHLEAMLSAYRAEATSAEEPQE